MTAYIVAFLSGPHAGISRSLNAGRYSVGRGLAGDVIIADPRLPEYCCEIELAHGRLRIVQPTIDVKTATRGQQRIAAPGSTLEADLPSFIELGESRLLIVSEAEPELSKSSTESSALVRMAHRAQAVAGDSAAVGFGRVRGLFRGHRGLVSFALLFFVALLLTGPLSRLTVQHPAEAVAPLTTAEQIIDDLGLEQRVQLLESSNGRLLVRGIVDDPVVIGELERRLARLGPMAQVQVRPRRQIETAIDSLVAGFRGGMRATMTAPGRVRLEGVAASTDELDRVVQALQRDVPGVISVDVQAISAPELVQRATQRIGELGLRHRLEATPLVDGIHVTGRLSADDQPAWQELRRWLDNTAGPAARLETTLTDDAGDTPAFTRIEAIWSGPEPYVIADGGKRYLVGAVVQGWRVERIEAQRIVLRRGQREMVIRL